MWPLVIIGALLLGGVVVKKRKGAPSEGPGPLEADPNAQQTAAEAAAAAQDALEQAAQGAAAGTPEGAQQANDALTQAAQAAAAAAGTAAQAELDALAKKVEELAKQAAANAGVPPPDTKSPTTSPGLPPIPPPDTGPTVVVEPAPPPGAPLPPPPRPTTPSVTLPTQLPTTPQEAVQVATQVATDIAAQLPIPITVTPTSAPPPLATEETRPELDPNGTIALARAMLDRETQPNWEPALKPQIAAWQSKMGLVGDGSYGPKSALVMANEVGVLPFVRAWPKGSDKRTVLQRYRDDLSTKAATLASKGATEHAKALQASAASEDARTFLAGSNPPPVSGQERLNQLAALTRQVA